MSTFAPAAYANQHPLLFTRQPSTLPKMLPFRAACGVGHELTAEDKYVQHQRGLFVTWLSRYVLFEHGRRGTVVPRSPC